MATIHVIDNDHINEIKSQIEEDEDIHEFDPAKLVLHFAYLVGNGRYFLLEHLEYLFVLFSLDRSNIRSIVSGYRSNKNLLCNPAHHSETRMVQYYYSLEIRARKNYERKITIDANPEIQTLSTTLEDLKSKITNDDEKVFINETFLCLQVEAHRSAIVMAWNLTYFHLINWVLADSDRKDKFNTELTTKWKSKTKHHIAINSLDDFEIHKESFVIDICKAVNLVAKGEHSILENALKFRNRNAHPTKYTCSKESVLHHLTDMLSNIVTAVKFSN